MSLDYIGIALLNNCRELFERVVFRLLRLRGIDDNELLPSAVVGQGDASDRILRCLRQIAFADRRNYFQLQPLQFFERQLFEQSPPG